GGVRRQPYSCQRKLIAAVSGTAREARTGLRGLRKPLVAGTRFGLARRYRDPDRSRQRDNRNDQARDAANGRKRSGRAGACGSEISAEKFVCAWARHFEQGGAPAGGDAARQSRDRLYGATTRADRGGHDRGCPAGCQAAIWFRTAGHDGGPVDGRGCDIDTVSDPPSTAAPVGTPSIPAPASRAS